jgi:hypothetical protein
MISFLILGASDWKGNTTTKLLGNLRLKLTNIEQTDLQQESHTQSHIRTDSTVSGAHLGPVTNFSFSLKFYLDSCYFVAPSLTRGRVCKLLLLLVLASAVPLESALSGERSGLSIMSHYLHKIFTLSVFDTFQGYIYNIYKASLSPGSVQQIMPQLPVAYTTMTV